MKKHKILFVCLGNICRSPLAHAVFEDLVDSEGLTDKFEIESCGTGAWHVGELPDSRMRKEAKKHGVEMTHLGRTLNVNDFEYFDLILPMDASNKSNLLRQCPEEFKHKIKLFRTFDPEKTSDTDEVPDPYYGGEEGFQNVYTIVERTARELLRHFQNQ